MDGSGAAELAARQSYGRLVAILAARTGDIAAAEDALAEAFVSALRVWPERGVPGNPEGWLLTAARRQQQHRARAARIREAGRLEVERIMNDIASQPEAGFPDERLKLLFVCAHPAIEAAARAPLMLQCVLGLEASQIASAFLVPPATMGQRLVRAKTKIRAAGIRFAVPEPAEIGARIADVLQAIYAAYGIGWDAPGGGEAGVRGLAGEALYLGRLAAQLLPQEPEAAGLASLMMFSAARAPARRAASGAFVPLAQQDTRLWSLPMIAQANQMLVAAAALGKPGPFQCEAAIQSVHCARAFTGRVEGPALIALYHHLAGMRPNPGVLVGRAAAMAQYGDARQALAALDELPAERVRNYQPYWATRAAALAQAGRRAEARDAYARAIGLSEDESVRAFLRNAMADTGA